MQKLLYAGVIVVIVVQVLSGWAIWKPMQLSELTRLFYDFQGARLVHFLGMVAIVGFLVVHVPLALLVPKTIAAMVTGGPPEHDEPKAADAAGDTGRITDGAPCIRTPSPSLFRPKNGVDQSALKQHGQLVKDIDRRNLLRGAVSLGALTMLTGCSVSDTNTVQSVLRAVSAFNDRVQELMFRPNHLAPTFSEDQVIKPPRFNAYYDIDGRQAGRRRNWKLELGGRIENKTPWTAAPDLRAARTGVDHPAHLRRGLGLYRAMVGAEPAAIPRAHRRRHQGEIRRVPLRRRLYRDARHGDRAASANDSGDQIRQGADHRSVRLSAAAARAHQARIQEREMGHGASK